MKKSMSKNQLFLKRSALSRNSSVKSFLAERSQQKEILSPNYKPFEIFFKYRRESPYYGSHRSRLTPTSGYCTKPICINLA